MPRASNRTYPRTQETSDMTTQTTTTDNVETENKPRRKRGNLMQMPMRLDAPKRDGWVRRFVNANPARIARMQELGYQLVQDRAGEGEARTHSGGSQIQRLSNNQGTPEYQVLMETPVEEYELGKIDKDAPLREQDALIMAGKDITGQVDNPLSGVTPPRQ